MNSKKYKRYIDEISARYTISDIEAEALFKMAIAKAYNAIGSAYVWEDGTITLVRDDQQILYIKNYVVSSKQYSLIVKNFETLLRDYAKKRDALNFALSCKGLVIRVEIIKKLENGYLVKPELASGAVDAYHFFLPNERLFFNESFNIGDKTNVYCKGFFQKDLMIHVSRFEEKIALDVFTQHFNACLVSLERVFLYKRLIVKLNVRTKAVSFILDWKKRPSAFVLSFLNKELKKEFGRCTISYKEATQ